MRWRPHKIRNTVGWVGIRDTQHENAGHIIGWIRAEDAKMVIDALNRCNPIASRACLQCGGMGWVPSMTDADTDPCPECLFPHNA